MATADAAFVDPQCAGVFASWITAAIARHVSVSDAVAAIEAGSDGHVACGAVGVGASISEVPLADAIARILAQQIRLVTTAFPEPGDPLGLSDIGPFVSSSVLARSAVIVDASARLGLVPEPDLRGSSYRGVRWNVFELPARCDAEVALRAPIDSVRIVEQADRALQRELREAADTLRGVDLVRWRPEAARNGARADAALQRRLRPLPAVWPGRARALAERAIALWQAIDVAIIDEGAISTSALAARNATLRGLSHSAREAAMVAFNAPASVLLGR